jgi:hypothetical protein
MLEPQENYLNNFNFHIFELKEKLILKEPDCSKNYLGLNIIKSYDDGQTDSKIFLVNENNDKVILKYFLYSSENNFKYNLNPYNIELAFYKKLLNKNYIHLIKPLSDIYICKKKGLNEGKLEYDYIKLIYLEYLNSGNLCDAVNTNLIDTNDTFIDIIFQLLYVLALLYVEINYIHGDLHTGNILFGKDNNFDETIEQYYEYEIVYPDNSTKNFYIPVKKYIPKLIDFDQSSFDDIKNPKFNKDNRINRITKYPNGRFKYTIHLFNNIKWSECNFKKFPLYNWINELCDKAKLNYDEGVSTDVMSINNIFNDDIFKFRMKKGNKIIMKHTMNIPKENLLN